MSPISEKTRLALERLKQQQRAIREIVDVLEKLPDWEARWSAIDYLHRQMAKLEEGDDG